MGGRVVSGPLGSRLLVCKVSSGCRRGPGFGGQGISHSRKEIVKD